MLDHDRRVQGDGFVGVFAIVSVKEEEIQFIQLICEIGMVLWRKSVKKGGIGNREKVRKVEGKKPEMDLRKRQGIDLSPTNETELLRGKKLILSTTPARPSRSCWLLPAVKKLGIFGQLILVEGSSFRFYLLCFALKVVEKNIL